MGRTSKLGWFLVWMSGEKKNPISIPDYTYVMVYYLSANYPICVVHWMMVHLDLRYSLGSTRGLPLFGFIVIQHHRCFCVCNWMFTVKGKDRKINDIRKKFKLQVYRINMDSINQVLYKYNTSPTIRVSKRLIYKIVQILPAF